MLLGAQAGERAFEAIVGWADGWLPGGSRGTWLAAKLGELRQRWVDAGRPERARSSGRCRRSSTTTGWPCSSTASEELAVDQVVFDIPTAPRDEILPLLDRYAKVIASDGDHRAFRRSRSVRSCQIRRSAG